MDEIDRLLKAQSQVISRRQARRAGLSEPDLKRQLRRQNWALIHAGVYVAHTGALTWQQRAWAAVLFSWPAALSHESALRAGDGPGRRSHDSSLIHVAVESGRHLVAPPGVRLHRMSRFDDRVLWNLGPPRVRYDQALLDLATSALTATEALALLAEACGSRRTTPARLLAALDERPRASRRRWLHDALTDIAEGSCSVLEHGYLTKVERPHGLPPGRRQQPGASSGRTVYRDVEYEGFNVIVELDGREFHDSAEARDRDLERDLDAAAQAKETIRIGFGQVFDRSCSTARKVGTVLQRKGWSGSVQPCPQCG